MEKKRILNFVPGNVFQFEKGYFSHENYYLLELMKVGYYSLFLDYLYCFRPIKPLPNKNKSIVLKEEKLIKQIEKGFIKKL